MRREYRSFVPWAKAGNATTLAQTAGHRPIITRERTMRSIPRLAAAAVALAAVLPATAADAGAAPVKAAGSAASGATLVKLTAFGQSLSLGSLGSLASTDGALDALVEFTPAIVNGAKTGTVAVTPSSGSKDVASVSTGAIGAVPASLLSATSPTARLAASIANGAPTAGLTGSLGSAQVLGTNLLGTGAVDVSSAVADATGAAAGKSLSIKNVGLPSLLDILTGLGLDVSALPLDAVRDLLRSLPGTLAPAIEALMTAAETAQAAVDTAQAQLDEAKAAAAPAQSAVTSATAGVTQADTAVAAATTQLNAALAAAGLTMAAYQALPEALRPAAVTTAVTNLSNAQSAADAAAAALLAANAAYAQAQAEVDAAQAALNAALATLRSAIDGVLAAAAGVLDVPLASIAEATVGTTAKVSADAKTKVANVTGRISGLKVLDADVLSMAGLGSTVDVVGTASTVVSQINAQAGQILTPVFAAINGAVPGLKVPTPTVEFLTKQTSTGTDGAYGTATAAVNAITVKVGSITIPTPVALPTLPTIPGITQSAGAISTAPIGLVIGQLSESSRFRPASLSGAPITPGAPAAPGAPGAPLPATGAPAGLAAAALLVTGLAMVARRRTAALDG